MLLSSESVVVRDQARSTLFEATMAIPEGWGWRKFAGSASPVLEYRCRGERFWREMNTAKDELKTLLEQQPEDSSSEELVRELAFHVMIQRGLADSDAGRTISNEEMGRRIRAWQK